jgi:hypothetical protein
MESPACFKAERWTGDYHFQAATDNTINSALAVAIGRPDTDALCIADMIRFISCCREQWVSERPGVVPLNVQL